MTLIDWSGSTRCPSPSLSFWLSHVEAVVGLQLAFDVLVFLLLVGL